MRPTSGSVEVQTWSMDSWSGREALETLTFKDRDEATAYVRKFNSKNDKNKVPEYYEYAELV